MATGAGKNKVWAHALWITAAVFCVSFLYAMIRYNVVKGVPWSDLPLYIGNKAIALTAVLIIALSYLCGIGARFSERAFARTLPLQKPLGLCGFGFTAAHALISFLLFTPAYYPKFFTAAGAINFIGQTSLLFGVLAFLLFSVVAISSLPSVAASLREASWRAIQRSGYAGLFLILLHVLVMGYAGWKNPAAWPGRLLPISLISFSVLAFTLLLRVVAIFFSRKSPK